MYKLPVKYRKPILFLEHCRILTKDFKLYKRDKNGDEQILPNLYCSVILGLGTNITHGASRCLAEHNTTVIWMSNNRGKYNSCSVNAFGNLFKKQIEIISNNNSLLLKQNELLKKRFNNVPALESRSQILGFEGNRMSEVYQSFALEYNIRDFKRNGEPEYLNFIINLLNSTLYGITESVIYSMKCSPHLGFIHNGDKGFVYDVADVFKKETSLRFAFLNNQEQDFRKIRKMFINFLNEKEITISISDLILDILK